MTTFECIMGYHKPDLSRLHSHTPTQNDIIAAKRAGAKRILVRLEAPCSVCGQEVTDLRDVPEQEMNAAYRAYCERRSRETEQ